jgi:hypothetical protein
MSSPRVADLGVKKLADAGRTRSHTYGRMFRETLVRRAACGMEASRDLKARLTRSPQPSCGWLEDSTVRVGVASRRFKRAVALYLSYSEAKLAE